MEYAGVLDGLLSLPWGKEKPHTDERILSRVEALEQAIGPEFDPKLYREQMADLRKYNSDFDENIRTALSSSYSEHEIERVLHTLNLPLPPNYKTKINMNKSVPDEVVDRVSMANSMGDVGYASTGDLSYISDYKGRYKKDYASIGDWSDFGDYNGKFRKDRKLFKALKWGGLALASLTGAVVVHGYVHAATLDGTEVLECCPNTESNLAGYRWYVIDETSMNDNPGLLDPQQGGSVDNWFWEDTGPEENFKIWLGLQPGIKYHFSVKAFNNETPTLFSGPAANEPIGVARMLGNIVVDVPGSENRIDGYDEDYFMQHYPSKWGEIIDGKKYDPVCDFDGDKDVDPRDRYTLILYKRLKQTQYNVMGTEYLDNSRMVEFDFCEILYG